MHLCNPLLFGFGREKPSELTDLPQACQMLDRRQLEEAFLLYACLEIIKKYNLQLDNISRNRNNLAEMVAGKFHDAFVKKWSGE